MDGEVGDGEAGGMGGNRGGVCDSPALQLYYTSGKREELAWQKKKTHAVSLFSRSPGSKTSTDSNAVWFLNGPVPPPIASRAPRGSKDAPR